MRAILTKNKLDNWKDSIKKMAIHNLNTSGYLAPVILLLIQEGDSIRQDILDISQALDSEKHKDMLSNIVKKICKSKKVLAMATLTEAWAAELKKGEDPNNTIRPRYRKDRKEIISISFETPFTTEAYMYNIIQKGKKKEVDESSKVVTNDIGGRFANMLAKELIQN